MAQWAQFSLIVEQLVNFLSIYFSKDFLSTANFLLQESMPVELALQILPLLVRSH